MNWPPHLFKCLSFKDNALYHWIGFYFIEIYLIYNVVLISVIYQSDSNVCVCRCMYIIHFSSRLFSLLSTILHSGLWSSRMHLYNIVMAFAIHQHELAKCVYVSSQSWLPHSLPPHPIPPGCTEHHPRCHASCVELAQGIHSTYGNVHRVFQ